MWSRTLIIAQLLLNIILFAILFSNQYRLVTDGAQHDHRVENSNVPPQNGLLASIPHRDLRGANSNLSTQYGLASSILHHNHEGSNSSLSTKYSLVTNNPNHGHRGDYSNKLFSCLDQYLPSWVHGDPEHMAELFKNGSQDLSDKYDNDHRFFYAYQPYLRDIVLRKLKSSYNLQNCSLKSVKKPKIKFLEIGLGCHPLGGMKKDASGKYLPGGSALGWRSVFRMNNLEDLLEFDLHVMEYDEECAHTWWQEHKNTCHIHTGDASSKEALARVVRETGSDHDFDVIIDDASHINWHQIKTLEVMIEQVHMGGIYIVEDIDSSCRKWTANIGSKLSNTPVGGSPNCMTVEGKPEEPTILAKLVEWHKKLMTKQIAFPDVNHIDLYGTLAVLEKRPPQIVIKWKDASSWQDSR